jgi:hypothetical protein
MITDDLKEDDQLNEEQESKPFINQGFVRVMAILFVSAIYFIIFLKILFLE